MFGVIGILSALLQRDLTGRGRHVQSALYESSTFLVGQHIVFEAHTGEIPAPISVRPRSCCIYETFQPRSCCIYETFRTRDGATLFIGITSDKQWKAFCEMYDRPELFADPKYDTNKKRRANHDALHAICQDIFLGYDAEPLVEMLVTKGLPAAPGGQPLDLQDNSQMNFENRMSTSRFANGATAKLPRPCVCFRGVTETTSGQSPQFGEHTVELLGELGFSVTGIVAMRDAGDIA